MINRSQVPFLTFWMMDNFWIFTAWKAVRQVVEKIRGKKNTLYIQPKVITVFSDWFGTKLNSIWCQINWKSVITIQSWFYSAGHRISFLCVGNEFCRVLFSSIKQFAELLIFYWVIHSFWEVRWFLWKVTMEQLLIFYWITNFRI